MMMLDTVRSGKPGDYYRGINVSYGYFRSFEQLNDSTVRNMLEFKRVGSTFDVSRLMNDVDTVITKYSFGKDPFAWDADFILYRAAAIHLYAAEITVNQYRPEGAVVRPNVLLAELFLNNGFYQSNPQQLGVRGRVGFADGDEYVTASADRIFLRHPFTNHVTGVLNIGTLANKQKYLEEKILEERARELAFEGERFYDLIRIARRRNDNSFLADRVAAKFEASEAAMIRERIMNEENWYIPFYIGKE
jgi:starch-binding outer membrane protein, SusD/RagB family